VSVLVMESILARSAYCSGRCALTGKARRRKHVCSSPAMQSAHPAPHPFIALP
jgi:hypothetical protein